MEKKRIAVVFGGKSSEHEISRISASYVIEQIPKDKYEVITVGITRDGRWLLYTGSTDAIKNGSWEQDNNNKVAFLSPDASIAGLTVITEGSCRIIKLDVIFPVLHGKNGEDGTIQGLFELSGIPYVGCNVLASANCMDKVMTNTILASLGIDQAAFTWCYVSDYRRDPDGCIAKIEAAVPYPIFVKPSNAGSSVGVSKACDREQLRSAIAIAAKEDDRLLFEETIVGKEVECAVLGNEEPVASIAGEIAPAGEFYDYDAKYNNAASQLFIPARISEEAMSKVRDNAVRAYRAIGCTGLSRVDFFVTAEGRVLLNEINTLPGFTSISMYPKLMAASNVDGTELVEKLIHLAFERS